MCQEQGHLPSVLGEHIRSLPDGAPLFPNITRHSVLRLLRTRLEELRVPDAGQYRTQDFRRGHAKDLQVRGASLKDILTAGEWKSPAYLKYQDLELLEHDNVVQAHLDDSSDED